MALFCSDAEGNMIADCGALIGGLVSTVYYVNKGQIDVLTEVAGEITTLTMLDNPATPGLPYNWFQIQIKKETAGFSNPAAIGTNSNYINQTAVMSVAGFDTTHKAAYDSLRGSDLVFIGEDQDGIFHMLGGFKGARMTAGDIGSGVANDDLRGSTMTFVAAENNSTPTVQTGITFQALGEDGVTPVTITI